MLRLHSDSLMCRIPAAKPLPLSYDVITPSFGWNYSSLISAHVHLFVGQLDLILSSSVLSVTTMMLVDPVIVSLHARHTSDWITHPLSQKMWMPCQNMRPIFYFPFRNRTLRLISDERRDPGNIGRNLLPLDVYRIIGSCENAI